MNWEAITAVTEVAGLIAVVASLIYIGTQTKQTNDHATFQMKVGQLVNHWVLARQLETKGLLDSKLTEEIHKVVIAVLSTPGGLEYWEHDARATPDGIELLAAVRERKGKEPSWIELMPWWGPD